MLFQLFMIFVQLDIFTQSSFIKMHLLTANTSWAAGFLEVRLARVPLSLTNKSELKMGFI